VNFYTMEGNDKSQEISLKSHEDVLLRLKADTIFNEAVKDGFEDDKVLGVTFIFGQEIIHIIFQYAMHDVTED
ncbi:hypothetical protein KI387_011564, partial [Taxus chinensis]